MKKIFNKITAVITAAVIALGMCFTDYALMSIVAQAETVTVSDFNGLKSAVAAGGDITITSDITLTETLNIDNTVTIKSQGTHTLIRGDSHNNNLFNVSDSGNLTLDGSSGTLTVDGGCVWSGDADSTLQRGISGTRKVNSWIIQIDGRGQATLGSGVTLQNHNSYGSQGAILLNDSGTLNINGAVIRNNGGNRGVIKTHYNSTVNMTGGEIYGNHAQYHGGAMQILGEPSSGSSNGSSNCNISGGHIHNNKGGRDGGAICVASYGHLYLSGNVKITDNETIDSSYGGGIGFSSDNTSLKIEGTVQITGNKGGSNTQNILVGNYDNIIELGTLNEGSNIGITYSSYNSPNTSDSFTKTTSTDYSSCFFSDNPQYKVEYKNSALYLTELNGSGIMVTYNYNGGSGSEINKTVYSGGTYGDLPVPTRSGFIFEGWYTEESGGTKITPSTTVSNVNNHDIYARWLSIDDCISITPTDENKVDDWYVSDIEITAKSGYTVGTEPNSVDSNKVTISDDTGTTGATKVIFIKDNSGNIYKYEFNYKQDKTAPTVGVENVTVENGKEIDNQYIGKNDMVIKIPKTNITETASGIAEVTYKATPDNGAAKNGVATLNGENYEIALSGIATDGDFAGTIQLNVKDNVGLTSDPVTLPKNGSKIIDDKNKPTVSITQPNNNDVFNTNFNIKVTVTDDKDSSGSTITSGGIAKIEWKDGEDSTTVHTKPVDSLDGTKEITISVTAAGNEGTKTYYVRAIDNAGNVGDWKTVTVTVDTQKPALNSDNLTVTNETNGTKISITTTENGKAYWIVSDAEPTNAEAVKTKSAQSDQKGGSLEITSNTGSFTITDLTAGTHKVYVVLEDSAGNLSEVATKEITISGSGTGGTGNTGGSGTGGGTGGSSGGGSGSGSTGGSSYRNPKIDKIELSWEEVDKRINKISDGGKLTVDMNGNKTVPSDVMKDIAKKDEIVTFIYNSEISYVIDGSKLSDKASFADLSVGASKTELSTTNFSAIGGTAEKQFTLGRFSITAKMSFSLDEDNAGKFASLMKLNSKTGKYEFLSTAKIAADGKALVDINGKGDYLMIVDNETKKPGDINNDTINNSKDALELLKGIVYELSMNDFKSDYNGDGKTNSKDALEILKVIVGLVPDKYNLFA